MKPERILFIDRDGTLIHEPETDYQVDSLEKLALLPGVIAALSQLKDHYKLVIISNQNGIGTASFPIENFEIPQQKMIDLFAGEDIYFDDVLVCPHLPEDQCRCRKPSPYLINEYLVKNDLVLDRANSAVIGDRDTDHQLAEALGIRFIRTNQKDPLTWKKVLPELMNHRRASIERSTKETTLSIKLNLDQPGMQISTPIPFFTHMLEQLSKHSGIGMEIQANGDVEVDAHHLVEDTGIAVGQAIRNALGNKFGIERYAATPMDEAAASIKLDLSGRPFVTFKGEFTRSDIGDLPTEMVEHFFHSLFMNMDATAHIEVTGENDHHKVESLFKTAAVALRQAIRESGDGIPSSKGTL